MKKYLFGILAVALAIGVSSFTSNSHVTAKKQLDRYWYADDDATYTGNHQSITLEIVDLEQNVPGKDFFTTQVAGSVAFEFGYSVQSPSGAPAETIYARDEQ